MKRDRNTYSFSEHEVKNFINISHFHCCPERKEREREREREREESENVSG